MVKVTITYVTGNPIRETLYADRASAKEGLLVIIDAGQVIGRHRWVPLTSIKHFETERA